MSESTESERRVISTIAEHAAYHRHDDPKSDEYGLPTHSIIACPSGILAALREHVAASVLAELEACLGVMGPEDSQNAVAARIAELREAGGR